VKRRSQVSGQPVKTRRLQTEPKRRNAPKAVRSPGVSISDLQEQLDCRTRERDEALEHQTATSEVLQAISSSMADAQPVFERILDSIERLFEFKTIAVLLAPEDGLLHLVVRRGIDVARFDIVSPMPLEETGAHRASSERRQMYFADVINGENVPNSLRRGGHSFGNFSTLITPMFWEAKFVGEISVLREPNAVTSRITARGPRSPALPSRSSTTSTPMRAHWNCTRRRLPGRC
jgi:hypothetical protein